MIEDQYERWFLGLRQYSNYSYDEVLLTQHFFRGLKDSIIGDVHLHQPRTLALATKKERIFESNVARGFSVRSGSQSHNT